MKTLAFCIDGNYIRPLAAALQSFVQHHNTCEYEVKVLYSNISSMEIDGFVKHFKYQYLEIDFIKVTHDFSWAKTGYHFNSTIFFRLLIPQILSHKNTILYLDADVIFLSNIDELFCLDITNYVLAAVPRHRIHGVPHYLEGYTKKYFAAGLLLFNVKEFTEQHCYQKCILYLKTHFYDMPDQDALNFAVRNSLDIQLRYGIETSFLDEGSPSAELRCEIENARIIQFSGSSKPWHFRNRHPYRNVYWKYLNMTIYKNSWSSDLTLWNILKWMTPGAVRRVVKRTLLRK